MTDQQIDEFLEMLGKSPTSARDIVRGLFAAHEAKAAPAVAFHRDGRIEITETLDATVLPLVRQLSSALMGHPVERAAPAVPQGWQVERRSDYRIRVRSPSGEAWSFEHVDDRGSANLFVYQMLDAMLAAPSQPVTLTDEWISVDDQKPPTNKPVLIHYLNERQRSKIVRAHYIPAKTVEAGEDDAADEYDEESDTYFVQEGWYEDNSESEVNYGITGQITHWRNLPPVPAIIAALREKEQTK